MVTIYKSFEDFSKDHPNLDKILKEMNDNPIYLLTVSIGNIPAQYTQGFYNLAQLAPEQETVEFLRKNKNVSMEILEPYIRYDVDTSSKSVGFEMVKLMNTLAPVVIVFNEVPAPYLKYVAEVLKLSLPDTVIRFEVEEEKQPENYEDPDDFELDEDEIYIED